MPVSGLASPPGMLTFAAMKNLVCTSCLAVNRADESRLAKAVCGKCATPLAAVGVLHLDAASFDKLFTRDGLPLLVDFWAPWCAPCRAMAPAFESAAAQLAPGVRLGKLDTEKEQALGARFHIQSIPTLVLFNDGRELDRLSGARSAQDIVAWVRARLA